MFDPPSVRVYYDVSMTVTASVPASSRRTLTVCGGAHALHDGFTDLLNALYPLLQAQFGLSYAAVGALKAVYSGAMASGQIPSGLLAKRFGGVRVLALGTGLIAVGYGLAGLTGSLYGVIAGLLLAGLGGSTQHPIASSLVSAAYPGLRSRTALGTYNFTGDLGKMALPAVFAVIAAALGWQQALVLIAAVAVVGAGVILGTLQSSEIQAKSAEMKATPGQDRPWAYWLLFSIHIADDLVRTGFLIFLPFLMRNKGADLPTIGLRVFPPWAESEVIPKGQGM
jgi:MFS transporter, FSR family, fosmidomycin resistance protein